VLRLTKRHHSRRKCNSRCTYAVLKIAVEYTVVYTPSLTTIVFKNFQTFLVRTQFTVRKEKNSVAKTTCRRWKKILKGLEKCLSVFFSQHWHRGRMKTSRGCSAGASWHISAYLGLFPLTEYYSLHQPNTLSKQYASTNRILFTPPARTTLSKQYASTNGGDPLFKGMS
jgi:hypothetical protein